jgi:hypothetical protein
MESKKFKSKEQLQNLPKPLKSKSIFKLTTKLMGKVRKSIITTTAQLSLVVYYPKSLERL